MRTFYIFQINNDISILLKDSPYNLYCTLESIYLMDKKNIMDGKNILEQIICLFDIEKTNKYIYNKNKDNDFYTKIGAHHRIINKYRDEEINIWIKNTHFLVNTNMMPYELLKFINYKNIFVCDFMNKDYFWLEKLFVK